MRSEVQPCYTQLHTLKLKHTHMKFWGSIMKSAQNLFLGVILLKKCNTNLEICQALVKTSSSDLHFVEVSQIPNVYILVKNTRTHTPFKIFDIIQLLTKLKP